MTTQVEAKTRYNMHCMSCDQVFQPTIGSPLWWKAKKCADMGRLDALSIEGEECGCVDPPVCPDAPFRVFGYDSMCEDFDFPCGTFVVAARAYLRMASEGNVVFITGVSDAVSDKLEFGLHH